MRLSGRRPLVNSRARSVGHCTTSNETEREIWSTTLAFMVFSTRLVPNIGLVTRYWERYRPGVDGVKFLILLARSTSTTLQEGLNLGSATLERPSQFGETIL